ncbi:Caffeine resistance protein 5 [Pseudocercospora fuligena]|uniref:Cercosporin MFS transporter CTB4 n=1 Tax=Pseudocercospora fuligena TaxID=685502 RepID=A0A8H6REW1_9PEZI|nr:Caffeine resistance protein 5 [Pseudocercospora fuligena]
MEALIRDAPLGQLIRYITKNRVLLYPEERPDFQCPMCYTQPETAAKSRRADETSATLEEVVTPAGDVEKEDVETPDSIDAAKAHLEEAEPTSYVYGAALHTIPTARLGELESGMREDGLEKLTSVRSHMNRVGTRATLQESHTQADLQTAFTASTLRKEPTRPIIPQRTSEGDILVDWYTEGDPENPQNWSAGKKLLASSMIYIYTLTVYMGSSIVTSSFPGIMQRFGTGHTETSLNLALYTLAYGIGPLIFSPLSEIPAIGRNPPYIITMAIFVILWIPAALADSAGTLLAMRFLQGFFGSPCLATGGASLQDMYSLIKLPYVLAIWAFAATCGPALGPLISGFSVAAEDWRWSLWEMLWLSGPVFILMLLFLPETSTANILLRRAQRLRKLTGDSRLKSQSEIDQANMKPKDVAFEAIVRPVQLMVMDPAIGFTALYTALCYGIYYSFFEAFPLVYNEMYGFNLGELGLAFLSILAGVLISIAALFSYFHWIQEPEIMKNGLGAPERRLIPALFASFLCPAGLFIFGWTSSRSIHWIVSIIGITIFTIGIFVIMQCIFVYVPLVYPQYSASLFAGNDFARSTLAFAAVLFSRPMYINLNIGPGTSLLGGLTAGCIAGVFALFWFGDKLRARSKFSAK